MRINSAVFANSVGLKSQLPEPGLPEIAFAGRSNVGKSSLINSLLQRKALARTSGQPGKTQTLNFYLTNESFYLVDLPGYGYAQVPQKIRQNWQDLLTSYLSQRESLKGVALVVDSRHPASPLDQQMFSWLEFYKKPLLIVATKVDKLRKNEVKPFIARLQEVYGVTVLPYSSEKNTGRDEIWRELEILISC